MKKNLLTILMLLLTAVSWAQQGPMILANIYSYDWGDAPNTYNYPNETPVYLKVNVLGTKAGANDYVVQPQRVAAFVNGRLRAVATSTDNNGFYVLRVMGDLSDENGATITFCALYNDLVYRFTATETFDGETQTHSVPVEVTLNPLMDVTLPKVINIEANLPATHDLNDDVTLVFADDTSKGSVLETSLTYTWDAANSASWIEVSNDGILTAKAETSEGGAYLGLNVTGDLTINHVTHIGQFSTSPYTLVNVKQGTIPVSSITVNPTSVNASIGDNIADIMRGLYANGITVLPTNASDRSFNWQPVSEKTEWYASSNMEITAAGTHQVKIYSISNPQIYTMLTINVASPLSLSLSSQNVACTTISSGTVTVNVSGSGFDASKVSFVSDGEAFNTDSNPYWVANPSGDGKTWLFQGKYVGNYSATLMYDGTEVRNTDGAPVQVKIIVSGAVPYQKGWNWISVTDDIPLMTPQNSQYSNLVQSFLIDLRSQTALLYNDPQLGLFGDITTMTLEDGMYKLKASKAGTISTDMGADNHRSYSVRLKKGYNWFSYPHEFNLMLEELTNTPAEGDMIIGKDAFATFSNGVWVHSKSFALEAGKGYIYYCTGESGTFSMAFNDIPQSIRNAANPLINGSAPAKSAGANHRVWNYDASGFADNMAVIASVGNLENPEQYTVGAFVDGECRGEGELAKDNIMFINVAGEKGEKVTFRLHNTLTGEFTDVAGSVAYNAKAGSMQAPVELTLPEATAIKSVGADDTASEQVIFNAAGQRMNSLKQGVNIVNGKKVVIE